jgi:hypothetical protein
MSQLFEKQYVFVYVCVCVCVYVCVSVHMFILKERENSLKHSLRSSPN